MAARKRDYEKEYADYHASTEQKQRRAMRNQIRRKLTREGKVEKGDGKDIDHKDQNPRNNSPSNVRIVPRKVNRSLDAAERKKGRSTYGK